MRIRISGMLACTYVFQPRLPGSVAVDFNVESILSIQETPSCPTPTPRYPRRCFAPAASVLIEPLYPGNLRYGRFSASAARIPRTGNLFDGASFNSAQKRNRRELGIRFSTTHRRIRFKELKTSVSPPEFAIPAGSVFDPDPVIAGNGLVFWGVPGDGSLALAGYGYWNSLMGSDTALTWDVRASRTDVFFTYNMYGGFLAEMATGVPYLRAGFTGLFSSEQGNSLFIEGILKDYAPGSKKRIDRNIHVLFEPRIQLRPADIAFIFYSPLEEENTNYIGGNLLIGFGDLKKTRMRGGMSVLASIDPNNPGTISPFSFSLTPFYAVAKGDFAIESAAVIHPLSFDEWRSAVQLQLRVKAVY